METESGVEKKSTAYDRHEDSSDEDMGCDDSQPFLLDERCLNFFNPIAKSCIDHYNEKHDSNYEFVKIVQIWGDDVSWDRRINTKYYLLIEANKSGDGPLETFQAILIKKLGQEFDQIDKECIAECKKSDVPDVDPPPWPLPIIDEALNNSVTENPAHEKLEAEEPKPDHHKRNQDAKEGFLVRKRAKEQ